jgi:hypothetical protein
VPHHSNATAAATAACRPLHATCFRLRLMGRPPPRVSIFDNMQYQLPKRRTFDLHVIIKFGNKIKQVDCLACKEEDCIRLNFVGNQSQSST